MTTAQQAEGCAEVRLSLGVYVLGALDPGERGFADGHLAACAACRDELAGLAGLPALLARWRPARAGRAGAGDVIDTALGEAPDERMPGPAGAGRDRNWWRYLAAAAAAAAAVTVVVGGLRYARSARTVVMPFSAGSGGWQSAQAASQATGASATVSTPGECGGPRSRYWRTASRWGL